MEVLSLSFAITIFKEIWKAIEEIQTFQEQLRVLAICADTLLNTLREKYRKGELTEKSTFHALEDLNRLLNEIRTFVRKLKYLSFVELLVRKSQLLAKIDGYQSRMKIASHAFQIYVLENIVDLQEKNERARKVDHEYLCSRLEQLAANRPLLEKTLNQEKHNQTAVMATFQKRISEKRGEQKELSFFTESVRYLLSTSCRQVDIRSWTISRFEVEFGEVIGRGGFGEVRRGSWNQTEVALKVMKNNINIAPSPEAVLREVETWSKLRHPHILQFLGANILDDNPFIVMPLIVNGNARDYINKKPKCDRLRLTKQVALGLVYLHSQDIIHGDLKGVNILVGDGEKALLCDFGLSRIKADINSRSMPSNSSGLVGSPNWMAPELFQGQILQFPCDVYSFGMTMYELFTNETPLGHIDPRLLPNLVVYQNTRPGRPNMDKAPQISDEAWTIIELCWEAGPASRPTADIVCNKLKYTLSTYPLVDPSNPHLERSPPIRSMSVRSLPLEDFEPILVPKPAQRRATGRIFPRFPRLKALPMVKNYRTALTLKNPGSVTSVSQSSDSKVLIAGLSEGSCVMWHISVAKVVLQLEDTEHPLACVTAIKFEPLTWTYVAGFDSGQVLYHHKPLSLSHSYPVFLLRGNDEPILCLHILNIAAMALICPGNRDPVIIKWGLSLHERTSTIVERLPLIGIAPSSCRYAMFSPNGKEIYIGTSGGSLFICSTINGQSVHGPFHLPSQGKMLNLGGALSPECRSLAISPNGKKVIVSYSSGEIRLWNIKAGTYSVLRDTVARHSDLSSSAYSSMPVAFSPDGTYVCYASVNDPQAVDILDLISQKVLSDIFLDGSPTDGIKSLDISSNNKRLTVAFHKSSRIMVYVWG